MKLGEQVASLQFWVHVAVRQSLPPQLKAEHNLTPGATVYHRFKAYDAVVVAVVARIALHLPCHLRWTHPQPGVLHL